MNGIAGTDDPTVTAIVHAASSAMNEHHLRVAIVRVEGEGQEIVTFALGESMTGIPAEPAMHFHNGAVAISCLGTARLRLVDEGVVSLDDPVGTWLAPRPPSGPTSCGRRPGGPVTTSVVIRSGG